MKLLALFVLILISYVSGFSLLVDCCGPTTAAISVENTFLALNYDGDLVLGGRSAGSEFLRVPVSLNTLGDQFTIEFWMQHHDLSADRLDTLLWWAVGSGVQTTNLFHFTHNQAQRAMSNNRFVPLLNVRNGATNTGTPLPAPTTFEQRGGWTHFSLAVSGTTATLRLLTQVGEPTDSTNDTPVPVVGTFTGLTLISGISGTSDLYLGGYNSAQNSPGAVANVMSTASTPANFDEFRIWNRALTNAEVNSFRFRSLISETGLLVNYNFEGGAATDTTGNGLDGTTAPGAQFVLASNFGTDTFNRPHLEDFTRVVPWNADSTFSSLILGLGGAPSTIVTSIPGNGSLAGVSANGMQVPTASLGNVPGTTFTYSPSRASCDTTVSIGLSGINSALAMSSNSVSVNLIPRPSSAPTVSMQSVVSQGAGTPLSFTGTGLGPTGSFTAGERVVVQLPNGITYPLCESGAVSSNTQVDCSSVLPGFGVGAIGVEFCGGLATSALQPAVVTFPAANITQLQGESLTSIVLNGANFGPMRMMGPGGDNVTVDSQPCTGATVSVSDSEIRCTLATPLVEGQTFEVIVNFGGIIGMSNLQLNLCSPACINNGTCVGNNVCDCQGTGFFGNFCQTPITCFPSCQNGGVCEVDVDGVPVCNCPDGFSGDDCAETGSNTNAIIAGVVVGGVCFCCMVIAIIGLVFIFLRNREPPRKEITPVEDKEWDKIIFGAQLTEKAPKSETDAEGLEKLLVQPNLTLAKILASPKVTQITEADKIAKALVVMFADKGQVLHLLEELIHLEVLDSNGDYETLFRANSMVSKLFKFYSRLIGLPYLYVTVGPEINELISENIGLEVDPDKIEEDSTIDLDEMRWSLMAQTQKILKQIMLSAEKCPPEIRQLLTKLKEEIQPYPNLVQRENSIIGSFFFLRFFCPAISSPEAYGIVDDSPPPESRRMLILITKVLQNLSNNVPFGAKEPYMIKINDFLQANQGKLDGFYSKLLKKGTGSNSEISIPKNIRAINLQVIAEHCRDNLDKIENSDIRKELDQLC